VKHFILNADRRVVEVDLFSWGRWVGANWSQQIARTEIGHLLVLTSFAGIDLSFGDGPAAFLETRVLDGYEELECREAAAWDEALAAHTALTQRWSAWAGTARDAAGRLLT
jgi:hypothetical protein